LPKIGRLELNEEKGIVMKLVEITGVVKDGIEILRLNY